MNRLLGILPLLIPVFVVDIALAATAVAHILRHPHDRFGNQTMWLVVAVALLLLGPMIYFVFGKGEDE